MRQGGVGSSDDKFIFHSIYCEDKKGERLEETNSTSYTRLCECFKEKLEFLGSACSYSLHSLRAGGATAAANNKVADRDRLF